MAIQIQSVGDNRRVILTYEALKTKVDPTLNMGARWLYEVKHRYQILNPDDTVKPYDDLTNTQKLEVIDQGVKDAIKNWAKGNFRKQEMIIDKAEIEVEANENYDI